MRSNPHTLRGPTLSEVRALVGEGCEGYPPNGLLILIRVPQNASPAQRGPRREFKAKEAKYFVAVISPLERLSEATREALWSLWRRLLQLAVHTDAQHIEDGINYLKQRAHDLALDDAAAP